MNLPDAVKQAGEAVASLSDTVTELETAYQDIPADVWDALKKAAASASDALGHVEKAIADL